MTQANPNLEFIKFWGIVTEISPPSHVFCTIQNSKTGEPAMLTLFTKSYTLFYRRSNVKGKKAAKDLILARFNNPFWAW